MRKHVFRLITVGCFLAGLAALSSPAVAETGNRFSIGAKAGGGSVAGGFQSWRAGFEFGYRAGKHLAMSADLAYGALTLENTTSNSWGYSARDSQKWTITPLSLSILYQAALNENANAYFGVGVTYNLFSRTVESQTNSSGQLLEQSHKDNFSALGPQTVIGLELALGRSASLIGALTYVFGTASREETQNSLTATQDINFGGASLTLGVRLYLF